MRYSNPAFGEEYYAYGEFRAGATLGEITVTLVWDSETQASLPITSANMVEIPGSADAGSATYEWSILGLTTPLSPNTFHQLLVRMEDSVTGRTQKAKVNLGGFADQSAIALFDGAVDVDAVDGVPGTAWPIGTAATPVDNLADALLIQAALGLPRVIRLHGTFTGITEDLSHFVIIGESVADDILEFAAAADLSNARITSCTIKGDLSGAANDFTLDECVLDGGTGPVTGLRGLALNCLMDGALEPKAGGGVTWSAINANSQGSVQIDFSSVGTFSNVLITGATGVWEIDNLSLGSHRVDFISAGSVVTLGINSSAGTILLAGVGDSTNLIFGGVLVLDSMIEASEIHSILHATTGRRRFNKTNPAQWTIEVFNAAGSVVATFEPERIDGNPVSDAFPIADEAIGDLDPV